VRHDDNIGRVSDEASFWFLQANELDHAEPLPSSHWLLPAAKRASLENSVDILANTMRQQSLVTCDRPEIECTFWNCFFGSIRLALFS